MHAKRRPAAGPPHHARSVLCGPEVRGQRGAADSRQRATGCHYCACDSSASALIADDRRRGGVPLLEVHLGRRQDNDLRPQAVCPVHTQGQSLGLDDTLEGHTERLKHFGVVLVGLECPMDCGVQAAQLGQVPVGGSGPLSRQIQRFGVRDMYLRVHTPPISCCNSVCYIGVIRPAPAVPPASSVDCHLANPDASGYLSDWRTSTPLSIDGLPGAVGQPRVLAISAGPACPASGFGIFFRSRVVTQPVAPYAIARTALLDRQHFFAR